MGSRVSNGTTSVGTSAHNAELNYATWTWAGWVKRTGAGESDYRLFNKASGTAIGAPNITGQGGALTRIRGRAAAGAGAGNDLAISVDGAIPADQWVCLFLTWDQAASPAIRIYQYNGVDEVIELAQSSTTNSGAAPTFNTAALTVANTTDGSQCLAGKFAYWAWTSEVWTTTDMLDYAQGVVPPGTNHWWPFQGTSPEPDEGEVGGSPFTISAMTFDGADSPPVTYDDGGDTTTADPLAVGLSLDTPAAAAHRSVGAEQLAVAVSFGTPAVSGGSQTAADPLAVDLVLGTPAVAAAYSTTAEPLALDLAFGTPVTDGIVPDGMVVGEVTGPERVAEPTPDGPALTRTITGAALRRSVTGPAADVEDITGLERLVDPTPDGPTVRREVDGPELARTLTGAEI